MLSKTRLVHNLDSTIRPTQRHGWLWRSTKSGCRSGISNSGLKGGTSSYYRTTFLDISPLPKASQTFTSRILLPILLPIFSQWIKVSSNASRPTIKQGMSNVPSTIMRVGSHHLTSMTLISLMQCSFPTVLGWRLTWQPSATAGIRLASYQTCSTLHHQYHLHSLSHPFSTLKKTQFLLQRKRSSFCWMSLRNTGTLQHSNRMDISELLNPANEAHGKDTVTDKDIFDAVMEARWEWEPGNCDEADDTVGNLAIAPVWLVLVSDVVWCMDSQIWKITWLCLSSPSLPAQFI